MRPCYIVGEGKEPGSCCDTHKDQRMNGLAVLFEDYSGDCIVESCCNADYAGEP